MTPKEFNEMCSGELDEAQERLLRESILTDVLSFLRGSKDKIVQWYQAHKDNESYRRTQEEYLRSMLREKGLSVADVPGSGQSPSMFSDFRAWLNRVGANVLEKVLSYLLYLAEPSLGLKKRGLIPQAIDILLLGAAIVAGGYGLFAVAAMLLGLKMGMKGFRDAALSWMANLNDEDYYESRQHTISKILED
jgi:hypothetical protein